MRKFGVGKHVAKRIALRTWREPNEANIFGASAQLGYYFLLALFPMLIFLTSLIGFIPGLQHEILTLLARIVPREAMQLVNGVMPKKSKSANSFRERAGRVSDVCHASPPNYCASLFTASNETAYRLLTDSSILIHKQVLPG